MEYCITSVFKRGFATWNIVLPLYRIQEDFCHMKYYIAAVFRKVCHMEYYLADVFKRVFVTKNTVLPLYSRGVLPHEICITTILIYHGIKEVFSHI